MKSLPKRKVLRWCLIICGSALTIAFLYVAALGILQKLYGGPRTTTSGEAHGFRIGMAKGDVLETYKALNEYGDVRAIHEDGMEIVSSNYEVKDIKMTPELKDKYHWRAYRRKFPIWFQDFYFDGEKLTNITTYIRFYETP